MTREVIHGDCLDVMATFEPESIDAIVTDPPYDLTAGKKGGSGLASVNLNSPYGRARIGTGNGSGGFMGKAWDGTGVAFSPATWAEAFRVAKPGAHLLAFGGTRTYHRLACAIEDAGWEIRDCLVWAYASGFPKSHDVSKAIDKAAGAERQIVGRKADPRYSSPATATSGAPMGTISPRPNATETYDRAGNVTAPATPEAVRWQGWGTALKPAWEPIVLARKPLRGTVAANVQAFGTGALNIDGCRIPSEPVHTTRGATALGVMNDDGWQPTPGVYDSPPGGRWPANVILTDPIFDGGIEGVVGGGEAGGSRPFDWTDAAGRASFRVGREASVFYDDTGTYSRFFLIPKAARSDREPILGGLEERPGGSMTGRETRPDRPTNHPFRQNVHPTVKPVDLMRHLVRLVTPPGGVVLDLFLGSGSTALACELEGFPWIGIEKEAEYVEIARARLNGTQTGMGLVGA